jgi:hypothetical protein
VPNAEKGAFSCAQGAGDSALRDTMAAVRGGCGSGRRGDDGRCVVGAEGRPVRSGCAVAQGCAWQQWWRRRRRSSTPSTSLATGSSLASRISYRRIIGCQINHLQVSDPV